MSMTARATPAAFSAPRDGETIDHDFETLSLTELALMGRDELNLLPFGVIGIAESGSLEIYNETEGRYAGLSAGQVLGRHFFTSVAPCMNNALVAGRLDRSSELDAAIDYVLTFRMRPTRVRMRLLKSSASRLVYLLIRR